MKNLREEPVDYILTVHVQNLILTYGEKEVKTFLKDIILAKPKKINKRKAA